MGLIIGLGLLSLGAALAQTSPSPAPSDAPTASPPPIASDTPSPVPSASATPAPVSEASPQPTAAGGQITIGATKAAWKDLELKDARISLAGPTALYIRNVGYSGKLYSLLARQDATTNLWQITEVFDEANNTFSAGTLFDLATIEVQGDRQLIIDGILLDGSPVKKLVEIKDDGSLSVPMTFESGAVVGKSLDRSKILGKPGYDEKVTGLERLNSDGLARIGSLETDVRNAKAELEASKAEQTKLLGENTALKAKITDLDTALTDLKSRNAALTTETESLRSEIAQLKAASTKTDGPPTTSSDADIAAWQKKVADLDLKVKQLETRIASVETQLAATPKATDTTALPNDVEALKAKIGSLQAANEQLMAERQGIEQKIREAFLASGYLATLRPLFTQKILAGFETGRKDQGSWSLKNGVLAQTDSHQYFSQYSLPIKQKDQTMIYRFTVKSTGAGWVGAGLHFYSNNSRLKGYGRGNSLLVWLTRDPAYYGNNRTYLQLYKSDDDIAMGRVLDAALPESIAQDLVVEVLYQPKEEYVTVVVNGVEKIRYKTWFNVNEGVEIALRTLNTAEFKGLEVVAKP